MAQNNMREAASLAGGAMKVGTKVYVLVGFCLGLLLLVSGISIFQMYKVGVEIEGIAERDLPMTQALTQITILQLEQAKQLERAYRLGSALEQHSEAKAAFNKAAHLFEELNDKVGKQFKTAVLLAKKALEQSHSADEKHEFSSVLKTLEHLDEKHSDYDYQVEKAFKEIKRGDLTGANTRLHKIVKEEEKLGHGLAKLLRELETFTHRAASTAEKHEQFALTLMLLITGIALLIGGFVATLLVRRSISRPLNDVVAGLEALNHGDFTFDVKIHNKDEIGAVAAAYKIFKEGARQRMQESESEALDRRKQDEKQMQMDKLSSEFTTSIEGIVETVSTASTELNETARSMAGISERTSDQASQAFSVSQQTASNVQSVATATEEMTSTIGEISQQVVLVSGASRQAVEEVGTTSEQMNALVETANKIDEIVEMISGIAEQTNLLALNATIESARAGEAGKGFAVVANEVKQLASQTAKATGEISQQINEIQSATKQASGSMENISEVIGRVDEISTAIAAAMEEQSAATQEIAGSVNQAAIGTEQVNDNIASVSDASQESKTASAQVLTAAQDFSQQAELLRGEVGQFISQIRGG